MKGSVKQKLRELELRPSKARGQNFLLDNAVIETILQFGAAKSTENLIEIGPGLGALSAGLYAIRPQLTLIELEERFCAELAVKFPQAKVIQADVRRVNFNDLGSNLVVFGNLPYSLSTDIVFHLIEQAAYLDRAVLMLQREFVERMCASPGGRDYGTLSIGCQLWAELRAGPVISGDSFHPPAKVESMLVELHFSAVPRAPIDDLKFFRRVVKASFLQRRRKLINSLKGASLAPDQILNRALLECSIDAGRRAETLSISEFAALASSLAKLLAQDC